MNVFTDQMGRRIELQSVPKRIISLVPSQTELLYDLGLENEVVGITKFCIHPKSWFRSKTRIGGTKNVNLEKMLSLQPDLIIANKEENTQDQIEKLAEQLPVWISDINSLEHALDMIEKVGELVDKKYDALVLSTQIKNAFGNLKTEVPNAKQKVAYLIWKKPYMSVGRDTFIHDMLTRTGFENILAHKARYPEVTIEELSGSEILLLSSEPYPFKQKDIDELQKQLPDTQIELVDGELFSWYGSRLLQAPSYFEALQAKIRLKA